MKSSIVSAIYTIISVAFLPLPVVAQQVNECGSSYIVLPGGSCHNLSYLTFMAENREETQGIEAEYQSFFDLNAELEQAYEQFPDFSETEEERDVRYQSLEETRTLRDDELASYQTIDNRLYRLQLRSMVLVEEAFR